MTDENIMTPEFRVSFPFVFRPQKAMEEGKPDKYSVVMLFRKGEKLESLVSAVNKTLADKFGADKTAWPKGLTLPFRDQGDRSLPGYEPGAVFITPTSKYAPGLVDAARAPIIDEVEFYAGCYARATLRPFYYEVKGKTGGVLKRGVSFALQNIQKLRDGDSLSGRPKPEDEFEPVKIEDGLRLGGDPMDMLK